MLAYLAIQLGIYGFFGGVLGGQMAAKFGIDQLVDLVAVAWAVVLRLSPFSVESAPRCWAG